MQTTTLERTPAGRARARAGLTIAAVLTLLVTAAGCPASFDARCADGACDPPDGSSADSAADAPLPDPCLETPTAPACLDDESALFVSKAGSDGADGTKAAPLATISAAIRKADDNKKRIYVCDGTYQENLLVQKSVAILGGIACDWTAKGDKPRVAPPSGTALTIKGANAVGIASLVFDAKADPAVPGDSAIAIFVANADGVVLRDVDVTAGAGVPGQAGADGSETPNYTGPAAVNGNSTSTTTGGPAPICIPCVDKTASAGGAGANVGGFATSGSADPNVGNSNSGTSGAEACTPGTSGANGPAGAASEGAKTAGVLSDKGWTSGVTAAAGGNGLPAQGGGGAGSQANVSLGGGSGGCGGCGGSGGKAGANGGSSFALLSFQSNVTIHSSSLAANNAAPGANGGRGQDGQRRGSPGGGACAGGLGGHGAGGGGGGGGAGGSSAAIAHLGAPPALNDTTLGHGNAGTKGTGGEPGLGSGNPGLIGDDGVDGAAADVLPLQ